jgi:hypothetical protein
MGKVKKKQTNIKLNKSYRIKVIVFFLFLLACSAIYALHSSPRKIELEYTVSPYSVDEKIMTVKVKIKPLKSETEKTFVLVKGSMLTSDEKCTDDLNKNVNFKDENGIIVAMVLNI